MRIHWNYGTMASAFYGCWIQKLTEKNFQIFISHLALTPIMSIGKSVSSFRALSKEEGPRKYGRPLFYEAKRGVTRVLVRKCITPVPRWVCFLAASLARLSLAKPLALAMAVSSSSPEPSDWSVNLAPSSGRFRRARLVPVVGGRARAQGRRGFDYW